MSGVQIFISYARDDDAVPPDIPGAKGFVTFLHEQLLFEFRDYGPDRPLIWRDIRHVDAADQFGPKIEQAIAASSIMVVVLSRNWMASDYCRRELESFAKRWSADGGNVRERIVVVSKRYVDRKMRPEWLQGQVGHEFYTRDEGDEANPEDEFFSRGKAKDDRYWEKFKAVSRTLLLRARVQPKPPPPPPSAKADRTIYVAKPANDMRAAYDRIVKELLGRGYAVVPGAQEEIPLNASAVAFIDTQIEKAEAAVHLLGEKAGGVPEDLDPIVKLQLARAAARLEDQSRTDGAASGFRRLIWAPKLLDGSAGPLQEGTEREPTQVLAKFDRQRPGDKIFGDNVNAFVTFLDQNLNASLSTEKIEPIDADSRVYVLHRDKDRRYALNLAKVLRDRNVEPILSGLRGNAAERNALHRRNLLDCDAVVLCWAEAGDVWTKASSRELKSWRDLGRSKKFAYRGLVLGPPPDELKSDFIELPPKSEIDLVLDLTKFDNPPPEDLDPLVPGAHAHHS